MTKSADTVFDQFEFNEPASSEAMAAVEVHFRCTLPSQYKTFMAAHDGGDGFVGAQYLILWRISELVELNRDYQVAEYAPGLLFFGSNGGGEAFAFDTKASENMAIRMVPFVGMRLSDAKLVGDSFDDFIARLANPHETFS